MEDCTRIGLHDLDLASRKSEEAAWRRFQAVRWLESLVGPIGISNQPSEREFISCLRNGLILCNAINKIQPGAVSKVVENHQPLQSVTREFQPLPAYQYFENVKNFLVAVEELKLPAFEASDLERDTLEAGSVAKVVDCILALKSYHEWKLMSGGNGFYKHMRSPLIMNSTGRIHSKALAPIQSYSCRRLDMSAACENQLVKDGELQKLEDSIVKAFAEFMDDTKENVDENLLSSFRNGNLDPMKLFSRFMSSCLEEQLLHKFPELKSRTSSPAKSMSTPVEDLSVLGKSECCKACLRKGKCNHRNLFQMQEKELSDLKELLSRTKRDFEDLQLHLQGDLKELGIQVQELSTAALGYHRVVKENRSLFNMVQDLKGNIRVYCRVRPAFNVETNNVIDFIGEDGSLVIKDPSKPQKDGRKVFQFNRVFGPSATQDDVFKDTQPLIRSVMDGYNVCIFAYGQTGSGKTHTMSGPSCGSTKDMGINYLALEDLFSMSNKRKDITTYEIHVQMVEIYNEQVRDLLSEDSSTTRLEIRSCISENGLSLPDATIRFVNSTDEVLNLMKIGHMNRVVSSTAMNNLSSRSHSILTVHVHSKDLSGSIFRSCLHLVDLAGSERVEKSEVTGERLKEAQYINKSLSCLGDVITALAQKNSHIPYRNSKLTLLLQDSLGGNAKTLMFAHVSPEGDSFGETLSTLKFAQRVSSVELGVARSNKQSTEVLQLKEQIESLKKALANKEAQSVNSSRIKEPRSPCQTPKVVTDRTPPRPQRLSIENSSTMQTEKKKGLRTPYVPIRARRISLEGPTFGKKDDLQVKVTDDVNTPLPFEAVSTKCQRQEPEAVSNGMCDSTSKMEVYHHKARSPDSAYEKRSVIRDSRTKIPQLQRLKTPEPLALRNKVQILMQTEQTPTVSKTQTHHSISITNGKGSQIRKSLRTIGKLMNGSEKRKQQNMMEISSPINCTISINNGMSPLTSNSRPLRRQSLTGVQTSGSDRSRRSSLGGKPADNGIKHYAPFHPPIDHE